MDFGALLHLAKKKNDAATKDEVSNHMPAWRLVLRWTRRRASTAIPTSADDPKNQMR